MKVKGYRWSPDADDVRETLAIFLRKLTHHEEHDHIHENPTEILRKLVDRELDGMCDDIAAELALTAAQREEQD